MPITVKEMRVLETNAIGLGISLLRLMEAAGKSVADVISSRLEKNDHKIVALMGKGGNGGDALVASRYLASLGFKVEIIPAYDPKLITSPDTKTSFEIVSRLPSIRIHKPGSIEPIEDADVIIDGLLGTGVRGKIRSPIKELVEASNNTKALLKVAIDTPTGVNPDTGEVHGIAFKADITVTFHDIKPGLLKAKDYTGDIIVANIGIPLEASIYVGPGDVIHRIPPRPYDAHKGTSGRILVIGGSYRFTGAPALAGLSALAAGADLSFIVLPETIREIIASYSPELITLPIPGKSLGLENIETVIKYIEDTRPHVLVVGPGLGRRPETMEAVKKIITYTLDKDIYLVLDADALKAFKLGEIKFRHKAVLTPHRGEFKSITGWTLEGEPAHDVSYVEKVAKELEAIILLKSPIDIISDGNKTKLNRTGNPEMAVGGTGDVLSGLVAGLLPRVKDPFHSACIAAYINGLAGDAVKHRGERVSPLTILDVIPEILNDPLNIHLETYGITPL